MKKPGERFEGGLGHPKALKTIARLMDEGRMPSREEFMHSIETALRDYILKRKGTDAPRDTD